MDFTQLAGAAAARTTRTTFVFTTATVLLSVAHFAFQILVKIPWLSLEPEQRLAPENYILRMSLVSIESVTAMLYGLSLLGTLDVLVRLQTGRVSRIHSANGLSAEALIKIFLISLRVWTIVDLYASPFAEEGVIVATAYFMLAVDFIVATLAFASTIGVNTRK